MMTFNGLNLNALQHKYFIFGRKKLITYVCTAYIYLFIFCIANQWYDKVFGNRYNGEMILKNILFHVGKN